jgi:hypothetical protein
MHVLKTVASLKTGDFLLDLSKKHLLSFSYVLRRKNMLILVRERTVCNPGDVDDHRVST